MLVKETFSLIELKLEELGQFKQISSYLVELYKKSTIVSYNDNCYKQ